MSDAMMDWSTLGAAKSAAEAVAPIKIVGAAIVAVVAGNSTMGVVLAGPARTVGAEAAGGLGVGPTTGEDGRAAVVLSSIPMSSPSRAAATRVISGEVAARRRD